MTDTETATITRIHARVNGTSGLPEAAGTVSYLLGSPIHEQYRQTKGRLKLIQKGNLRVLCREVIGGEYFPTTAPGVFAYLEGSDWQSGSVPHGLVDITRVLYLDDSAYQVLAAALDELLVAINYDRHLSDAKQQLDSDVIAAYHELQEEE